ncbi:hypothetical protein OsI_22276 [Oryza sativa Indica Group]|uniref:Uncharacterized protein n=1 Tax=Oryza sativa subsp. indica TaxID=39946 RepID=B8B4A9_ORYSI|nr:hypothetical protein OsI_22276 [Oryza sativa Indica Group]
MAVSAAAAGMDEADAAFFSRRGNRCCCFWGRAGVVGAGGWAAVEDLHPAVQAQPTGPPPRRSEAEAVAVGVKLNYDPLSYALNFDEGHGGACSPEGDYAGYRDFSTRFVAPPPPAAASAKSSMDFGGRDAPPLFHHPPPQQPHPHPHPPSPSAARG